MTAPQSPASGRIITFYSYKGGTGRTMALANVGWLLASLGRRVLAIDWDLEAPGLHRYYHPFLDDPELSHSPGLMDFLQEFVVGARRETGSSDEKWYEAYANLLPYTLPVAWTFPKASEAGLLDIVPAGRQDGGYATRVALFDWQRFYDRLGGGVLLEAVKQRLRAHYDVILIDSRTGLSDTSGICSIQMPDDLVCCFTLNSQSIQGARAAAESAFRQRLKPSGEPGLRVWPVPTRVELSQRDKLELARRAAREAFHVYLSHLPRDERERYFASVEVLYDSFYAYEETLATLADRPDQTGTMLTSMISLTAWLAGVDQKEIVERARIPERERLSALERFTRKAARQVNLYVAYAPNAEDAERLGKLARMMPTWYLGAARGVMASLAKVGLGGAAASAIFEQRQLLDLLARRFAVTVRADLAEPYGRLLGLDLAGGSIDTADAVVVPLDPGWGDSTPTVSDALQFELAWALKGGLPVFLVQLPSVPTPRLRGLPERLEGLQSQGVHTVFADDFQGSVDALAVAIEKAANRPRHPQWDALDDPQKGRWGGVPERNGRRLSAEVEPIGEQWFRVVMTVAALPGARPLSGEVVFHLHPTFPQSTLKVPVANGLAVADLKCWGAFTVGAVADAGETVLELDLAEPTEFPAVFRER